MVKYVSFTKTHLLIIVSGVVINDWNAINKNMFVNKSYIFCIYIIKGPYNLRE